MTFAKGGKIDERKIRKCIILSKGKIMVKEEVYQKYGEKILKALHGNKQSEITILKEEELNENTTNR